MTCVITRKINYLGYGLPPPWADDYDKSPVEQTILGAPDLPGTVTDRATGSADSGCTLAAWTTVAPPY